MHRDNDFRRRVYPHKKDMFFIPYLANNNRFYFILFGNIAYLTSSMFKFTTKYYANEVQVPYVVTSRPHNPKC